VLCTLIAVAPDNNRRVVSVALDHRTHVHDTDGVRAQDPRLVHRHYTHAIQDVVQAWRYWVVRHPRQEQCRTHAMHGGGGGGGGGAAVTNVAD
jgi:hypothetical protein